MKSAVVIGAGFGGLAVANRLQAAGCQVTLLERREKVGGRAYQLTEGGYTFDMGPSLITAPDIIRDIFAAAGRQLEDYVQLQPLEPFYRVCFHDGSRIDYSGDPEAMKRQMADFNPDDAKRYDDFMTSIRPIYEAIITDGLGATPFDSVRSMVDFLPRALRLKAYLPVASYVARFFRDFRHRFIFSFHPLFIGGNPFRAPSVYLMIPYLEATRGVWYTRGGMYEVVDALAELFEDQGGCLRTGAEVSEIIVENGAAMGVRLGEEEILSDIVISNADVAHTYRDLVSPGVRRKWSDRRLDRVDFTMSCFLIYMGVRKKYPGLAHHTIIVSRRYRELVEDIFTRKILADDFSIYLHAPSRTDSSMAPPDGESIYALVPVPNLTAGIDWEAESTPFAGRVLSFLEQWGLDGLRENLDVLRIFTPLDFRDDLNAFHGNAFGIEPRLTQTAYFRPHNQSEDVANLYLVGAGTHPGAGVPGVMLSAEATMNSIRRDHVLSRRSAAEVD